MTTVVVVGAALAGVRAAQTLRAEGFDGHLVMVGEETHLPYDRPPLSKEFLLGKTPMDDLGLLRPDQVAGLEATWRLGARATSLDTGTRVLHLDGDSITYDGLVIATGSRARRLPANDLGGSHPLRTIDDAQLLRDALAAATHVTIVGAGLIGGEVASTARALGREVVIIETCDAPFERLFGRECAALLQTVHAEHEVRLITGQPVSAIDGDGHVEAVTLADGQRIPTDLLVVGIGAVANDEWLSGSAVEYNRGVLTDEFCRTTADGVVAAGDVARYRSRRRGLVRDEHWSNARAMPVTAAKVLVKHLHGRPVDTSPGYDPLPYFWTHQHGAHIQVAGDAGGKLRITAGSFEDRQFAGVTEHAGKPIAAVGWNHPSAFTRLRRDVARAAAPHPG